MDYIRLTLSDFNGISRSKLVPARIADKFTEKGIGIYSGKTFLLHLVVFSVYLSILYIYVTHNGSWAYSFYVLVHTKDQNMM